MLLQRQLLRSLEQAICSLQPKHSKISKQLDYLLCKLSNHLGIKVTDPGCSFHGKAEYISMSQSLRDVLPIMFLIQEMMEKGFQVICTKPYIYCKVFKDNSGALELAWLPKLHPCTKHINVCYHHFCEHMRNGLIKIFPISTKDQTSGTLPKALAQNNFQCHCCHMCGL